MQKLVSPRKIAQRVAEGLDATETKFFQKDGAVKEEREVIAYGERREYAKMAAEYSGYVDPQKDKQPIVGISVTVENIGTETVGAPRSFVTDVVDVEPERTQVETASTEGGAGS